ncbi:MAG: hypothetical protein BroJett025_04120 [Patescibacteria group bacterium]|nr:MAG: hypothetical protein BroJett025_04120 [Patescibacteria group bacterium]
MIPITDENEKINPIKNASLTCDSIKMGLTYDMIASANDIKKIIGIKRNSDRFFTFLL